MTQITDRPSLPKTSLQDKAAWIWVGVLISAASLSAGLLTATNSFLVEAILVILSHVGSFLILYLYLKRNGYSFAHLHLGTVFLGTMIAYGLIQLTEGVPLLLGGNNIAEQILLSASIAVVSFTLSYSFFGTILSSHNRGGGRKTVFLPVGGHTLLGLFGLLLIGMIPLGYGYLIMTRAGGIGGYLQMGYAERHLIMRGLGWVGAGHVWFRMGVILLYYVYSMSRKSKWAAVSLVAVLSYSVFFFIMGDRGAVVYLILALAVAYLLLTRRSFPLRLLVPAAVAGWFAAQVIRVARALPFSTFLSTAGWVELFGQLTPAYFSLTNSEFTSLWRNHQVIFPALENGAVPMRLGMSYVEAFIQVVPIALFPNRPPAPAEWFAHTFFPGVFEIGGGFAFSMLAEAYWNFRLLGVAIVFLLVGFILTQIDTLRNTRSLGIAGMVLYANLAPPIFLLVRDDFATFLKRIVILIIPAIVIKILTLTVDFHAQRRLSGHSSQEA